MSVWLLTLRLCRGASIVASPVLLGLFVVGCGGGGSSGGGTPAEATGATSSPATSASTTPALPGAPVSGAPASGPATSPTGPLAIPPAVSLAAFESSLYPLLRTNCVGCHASNANLPQAPFHAEASPPVAHDAVLPFIRLDEPEKSRLVWRLTKESHQPWSGDAQADGEAIRVAIVAWANALKPYLGSGASQLPVTISEASVEGWIKDDQQGLTPAEAPYMRYVAVHEVRNDGGSDADVEVARVGVSKTLNSVSRWGPKIANPVAVDPYKTVFRVDTREYFGFSRSNGAIQRTPDKGPQTWDDTFAGTDRKTGVKATYVSGAQLAYTTTRPDVYNELLEIPGLARRLESELGVDKSQGVDSYKYMVVDRDPITIENRLMMRADLRNQTVQGETAEAPNGFYWSTTDTFSGTRFPFFDEPVPEFVNGSQFSQVRTNDVLVQFAQAQAQEIIFSLPNGLQAYMIAGAVNQRRVDAFTFIVVDPLRGGPVNQRTPGEERNRLLNGISCISCHEGGMKFNTDAMRPHLVANQNRFSPQVYQRAMQLYPGDAGMQPILQQDKAIFTAAMNRIIKGVAVDQALQLNREPIYFLAKRAQTRYGYDDKRSE